MTVKSLSLDGRKTIAAASKAFVALFWFLASFSYAFASEADIELPDIGKFSSFDFMVLSNPVSGDQVFYIGLVIALLGVFFGIWQYITVKKLPVHKAMSDVSNLIWETCKTYLKNQGKFLIVLWVIIAICMFVYFAILSKKDIPTTVFILLWSLVGMAGSYGVAWFGIRINTLANSRASFASLKGKPYPVYSIPIQSGMSIGLLLVSVELLIMLAIFLWVDPKAAGACFIGFAIGESLGASVLRICGGIFTKIADIGSDLMKIVFNIKEDDARNPGVIADCTGDNAGDSVGPTADGFETYGVTGVALIVFISLAVPELMWKADFMVWIFTMRFLMILTSIAAYFFNDLIAKAVYKDADEMDFEAPLTWLIVISSLFAILLTFVATYLMFWNYPDPYLWAKLAGIISCGTIAATIIPELTKVFTSANSKHVQEVVNASREGGPSLNILSGMVAGNFSGFWMGLSLAILMAIAWWLSSMGLEQFFGPYYPVFAFGLVAFGLLGMGPVTIAVDSYGPVTDNAQSVYELSLIEEIPNIKSEIEAEYGFKPVFKKAKYYLEKNDGAGNTFKATAKPVLIGTAVVGATAMIFSIIMMLQNQLGVEQMASNLSLLAPQNLLGFIMGGAVVYWFCGASMQAVTTGAYRAVEFIKKNIKLDGTSSKASVKDSNRVVEICTKYAQDGMFNIFIAIFLFALGFACFNPFFFISYLISLALFGLFAAVYMANAGGSWDNAKKVVEVDLKEKGTPIHAASVVGDTVGDPYKDTSSVSLNPIIKFTTLFGLLAVEIAVALETGLAHAIGIILIIVALLFVWRSFYSMRISSVTLTSPASKTSEDESDEEEDSEDESDEEEDSEDESDEEEDSEDESDEEEDSEDESDEEEDSEDESDEEEDSEDKKPEEKKEDKKPEGKKSEDKKPEEKKSEDKKPEDKKSEDKKPEDKKPEDKKSEDKKSEDKKSEDKKPEDKKPEDKKSEDKTPRRSRRRRR